MNLKLILLGACSFFLADAAYAQDEIHLRNGDVIEGRIRDVGKKTIRYKASDKVASPEYEIDKKEIVKLEYEDGTIERFSTDTYRDRLEDMPEERRRMHPKKGEKMAEQNRNYGNNILAVSPIQIAENGVGIGLSYERVLDKKAIVSFYMPISYTFSGDGRGNDYYYGRNTDLHSVYFMPGLKIYPTGSKGVVKYSIGPSFLFAVGEDYNEFGDYYHTQYYGGGYYPGPYYYDPIGSRFTFGMMINNTLNINATPHLHMGLELGLGLSYLHYVDGVRQNTIPLTQLGFKIGYRW